MGVKLKLVVAVFSFGLWGCATPPAETPKTLPPSLETPLSEVQLKDLAGGWEYEEGSVIYPLNLDKKGNGTYQWKNGRFETKSLTNGIWKGTWYQEENDREGKFELQLQPDLQSAAGRWWYTRIGEDHAPLEPGGNFRVRRSAPPLKP